MGPFFRISPSAHNDRSLCDGRRAIGYNHTGPSFHNRAKASCTRASFPHPRKSGPSRMRMQVEQDSPGDGDPLLPSGRDTPRSPTTVWYPSGRAVIKSWALAILAAAIISSRVAPGFRNNILRNRRRCRCFLSDNTNLPAQGRKGNILKIETRQIDCPPGS